MSEIDTLDAITDANSALVKGIQSLPPDEAAAEVPKDMCLVMTYGHLTDMWTLHIVPRKNDRFGSDVASYTCGLPDTVRTVGDIAGYLSTDDWMETLFRMSQDFDGSHDA